LWLQIANQNTTSVMHVIDDNVEPWVIRDMMLREFQEDREGGWLVFGSGIAKPHHMHKSTHSPVMSFIHTFITGFTIRTYRIPRSKGGL